MLNHHCYTFSTELSIVSAQGLPNMFLPKPLILAVYCESEQRDNDRINAMQKQPVTRSNH